MEVAPGFPPVFIAAGLDDPVVSNSERLELALQGLQSPCSAHYYAGETHGFNAMFWRKQAILCWRDTYDFLHKNLPLKPQATPF